MNPNASHASPARGLGDRLFVGRGPELAALLEALDVAASGSGRLFLVGGEAGIGKSRLADEVAEQARQRGFLVLWGRCWEAGGAPAFWPWVQSLRSYVQACDPAGLQARLGGDGAFVAQLLPELTELVPGLPAPPSLDPESARFRLFDAVTTLLRNAARERPLALVLDDLHVADAPSLLLLRFLAAELARSRILLIGAYRHNEVGPDHPLAATLAEASREQATRSLLLAGLSEPEVARFIQSAAEQSPPA